MFIGDDVREGKVEAMCLVTRAEGTKFVVDFCFCETSLYSFGLDPKKTLLPTQKAALPLHIKILSSEKRRITNLSLWPGALVFLDMVHSDH